MGRSEYVGVDGCRSGWFSVGFDSQGCYELKVFPAFSELLAYYRDAKLVLVDIPIGLMEGPGRRECDGKARKVLKGRSSSVFPVPTRQTVRQVALSPEDYCNEAYRAASEIERRYANRGISKQTFAISHKIAQVDEVMLRYGTRATPSVREIHPEVCFWALNKENAMSHRKKVRKGREERIGVLECIEPRTQAIFEKACSIFLRKCVGKDDILDALVAAVTARLGHDRLKTIPDCPPKDAKCLPMEMVYYKP